MDSTLDDQLCFALYAASRAAQGAYREALSDLDITYLHWLVLLVLWEQDGRTVGELGDRLRLDSGTLSPLLRRMEQRGLVTRQRPEGDNRRVIVRLTDEGRELEGHLQEVRRCLLEGLPLTQEERTTLRDLARRAAGLPTPPDIPAIPA